MEYTTDREVLKAQAQFGVRVRLRKDVVRFAFKAQAGQTGRVAQAGPDEIRVLMDEEIKGAGEWGNCIEWYKGSDDPSCDLSAFEEDCEIL